MKDEKPSCGDMCDKKAADAKKKCGDDEACMKKVSAMYKECQGGCKCQAGCDQKAAEAKKKCGGKPECMEKITMATRNVLPAANEAFSHFRKNKYTP